MDWEHRPIKLWLEQRLAPIVRALDDHGIRPDQVTLAGLVLALLSAALILLGWLALAGAVFFLGSLCDAVDGALARHAKTASRFGAFLDSTLDRVSEGVVLAALATHLALAGQAFAVGAVALALLGGMLTSYTRARAEALGMSCSTGWISRVERVVLLGIALLFDLVTPIAYALAVLTTLTATQRIWHVRKQLLTTDREASSQ